MAKTMTPDPTKVSASPTTARPVVPPRPVQPAADPIADAVRAAAAQPQSPPLVPPVGYGYQQPGNVQNAQQFGFPSVGMDGAVGSLMSAVLNQQRAVGMKFHMLLVPELTAPTIQTFDRVEDLRSAIQENLGTSAYVYCFMGHVLRITKGPFRFLQTPYGAIPLHDVPTPDAQETDDGWMGQELPLTEFSITATAVEDDSEEPDEEADETTDDDDDGDQSFEGTDLFG